MKALYLLFITLLSMSSVFAESSSIKQIIRTKGGYERIRLLHDMSFRDINTPENIKYLKTLMVSGGSTVDDLLFPICMTIGRGISDYTADLKDVVLSSLTSSRTSMDRKRALISCVNQNVTKTPKYMKLTKRLASRGDQYTAREFLEKLKRSEVSEKLAQDLGKLVLKNKRKRLTETFLKVMAKSGAVDMIPYHLHVVKYSSKNDEYAVLSSLRHIMRSRTKVPLSMINDLVDLLRYRNNQIVGMAIGLIQKTIANHLGLPSLQRIKECAECFPQGEQKAHSDGVVMMSAMMDIFMFAGGSNGFSFSQNALSGYTKYKPLTLSKRRKLKRIIRKIIQAAQK